MADFLLELFSEEIPARLQPAAAAQLKQRFEGILSTVGIVAHAVEVYVTPRRLALIARGLPAETPATTEERRGPRADAADTAIAGFLKSTGLTREQLVDRATDKGQFLFARVEHRPRPLYRIFDSLLPHVVAGMEWPKSMQWPSEKGQNYKFRWVRPLRSVLAIIDSQPMEVESLAVAEMLMGYTHSTRGHRFMGSPEPILINSVDTYAAQLRANFVVLSSEERCAIIRKRAAKAAEAAGLVLVPDAGLEAENAGLTEWPVPLLGRFDTAFLDVPREIIQLTMRTNQKYFALVDGEGALAPAFVCVANLEAPDGGATIVAGNERVLSARLADARFFWEQDKAKPLEVHAEKLKDIVFHEKLGTMAEKVERVAKLARWLVETHPDQFPGATPETAERAARLAKADLTTATVGEFPELQGVIGRHLAQAQGECDAVAEAIRSHHRPAGLGDDVPAAPVSVAVGLADRFDNLICFFAAGERPSGSRDPFALRRAALGAIRLILENGLRFSLNVLMETMTDVIASGWQEHERLGERYERARQVDSLLLDKIATGDAGLVWFFADRLKVQQREAGIRPDVIDGLFGLGGEDDLVRLSARVKALQALIDTDEGANLLGGYKRAANILRIEEAKDGPHGGPVHPALLADPAEQLLDSALTQAQQQVASALEAEDFAGAMAALAAVRPAVDGFFEGVKVNADDPAIRANRLALLAKLRQTAHRVADFSKIQGGADA